MAVSLQMRGPSVPANATPYKVTRTKRLLLATTPATPVVGAGSTSTRPALPVSKPFPQSQIARTERRASRPRLALSMPRIARASMRSPTVSLQMRERSAASSSTPYKDTGMRVPAHPATGRESLTAWHHLRPWAMGTLCGSMAGTLVPTVHTARREHLSKPERSTPPIVRGFMHDPSLSLQMPGPWVPVRPASFKVILTGSGMGRSLQVVASAPQIWASRPSSRRLRLAVLKPVPRTPPMRLESMRRPTVSLQMRGCLVPGSWMRCRITIIGSTVPLTPIAASVPAPSAQPRISVGWPIQLCTPGRLRLGGHARALKLGGKTSPMRPVSTFNRLLHCKCKSHREQAGRRYSKS